MFKILRSYDNVGVVFQLLGRKINIPECLDFDVSNCIVGSLSAQACNSWFLNTFRAFSMHARYQWQCII